MSPDSAPVALHRDSADPVRLKWHRARRRAADRPFTRDRILEGMRLGASIEIDLRVRDDLRYAVIHDVDDPPRLYLDDLAALLADAEIHPDALLQLDFKDTHAQLDQAAVDRFAESVAPFAGHAIVSCGDPVAVAMLTGPVPDIRIGYDPCHRWAVHRVLATRRFTRFVGRAIQASPDAEMVYLEPATHPGCGPQRLRHRRRLPPPWPYGRCIHDPDDRRAVDARCPAARPTRRRPDHHRRPRGPARLPR